MKKIEILTALHKIIEKDAHDQNEQSVEAGTVTEEEIINRKLWDSDAEEKVFQHLQEFVNTDSFYIIPHILVSEVIKNFKKYDYWEDTYKKYCEFIKEERKDRHFELTHFDFVIYNKKDFMPVLIVEVDGARHKTNPSAIHFDKLKNYIAEQYEIPLARLELYNPDIDIESGLKKILTDQNLNDPYNYPIYCWRCGKKFLYQKKKSFYYCNPCQRRTGKNVTLSYNEKICPPLFVWDK